MVYFVVDRDPDTDLGQDTEPGHSPAKREAIDSIDDVVGHDALMGLNGERYTQNVWSKIRVPGRDDEGSIAVPSTARGTLRDSISEPGPDASSAHGEGYPGAPEQVGPEYYKSPHHFPGHYVIDVQDGSLAKRYGASKVLGLVLKDIPWRPSQFKCYYHEDKVLEPQHGGAPTFSLLPREASELSAAEAEKLIRLGYSCGSLTRSSYNVRCQRPEFSCVTETGRLTPQRPGDYDAEKDLNYRSIPLRDCAEHLKPPRLKRSEFDLFCVRPSASAGVETAWCMRPGELMGNLCVWGPTLGM